MHFLKTYFDLIIRYDLINKFTYSNNRKIPQFSKIILSLSRKNNNLKDLVSMILFFNLLSYKIRRKNIIRYKKSNVLVKVKKGYPIGCKVILGKTKLYKVFELLLTDILINEKNYKALNTVPSSNSFDFRITPLKVKELDKNYYGLFRNLPWLNITFLTTTKTKKEFSYLLKAYKLTK